MKFQLKILTIIFVLRNVVDATTCERITDTCPNEKINFRLYTSQETPYEKLFLNDTSSIVGAKFIENAPIKMILHGYTGSMDNPLMQRLIIAFLQFKTPVNVIGVNYEKIAKEGCYPVLFRAKSTLGKCIAELIMSLLKFRNDIKIEQLHIIGFSIGAHIAAQIANNLKSEDLELERITGLDPAFMFFFPYLTDSKSKLNKEHAKFVDVIHTNIFWYGIPYSGGHYDLYANGGHIQPNCNNRYKCSHAKSVRYYISTIYNRTLEFEAYKIHCPLWRWLIGMCDDGKELISMKIGENAVKPSEGDEGSYNFFTIN